MKKEGKKEGSFFKDFQAVQKELSPISKNAEANAGSFKYQYADLPQVWDEIRGTIAKHNFVVFSEVKGNEVVTGAMHKDGTIIQSGIEMNSTDPQKKGSEITYYRRYNLLCIFNVIVEGEDDDGAKASNIRPALEGAFNNPEGSQSVSNTNNVPFDTNATPYPENDSQATSGVTGGDYGASQKQKSYIATLLSKNDLTSDWVKENYGTDLEAISGVDASEAIKTLLALG